MTPTHALTSDNIPADVYHINTYASYLSTIFSTTNIAMIATQRITIFLCIFICFLFLDFITASQYKISLLYFNLFLLF